MPLCQRVIRECEVMQSVCFWWLCDGQVQRYGFGAASCQSERSGDWRRLMGIAELARRGGRSEVRVTCELDKPGTARTDLYKSTARLCEIIGLLCRKPT